MSRWESVLLSISTLASPPEFRSERREQWEADLRDAREVGLSRSEVLLGSLFTALTSAGPHPRSAERRESRRANAAASAFARLAVGALAIASVASGPVLVAAVWAAGQLEPMRATSGASGPVTWGSIDDQPPAEKVDLSTLLVVGVIDPATGEILDVAPYHPEAVSGG